MEIDYFSNIDDNNDEVDHLQLKRRVSQLRDILKDSVSSAIQVQREQQEMQQQRLPLLEVMQKLKKQGDSQKNEYEHKNFCDYPQWNHQNDEQNTTVPLASLLMHKNQTLKLDQKISELESHFDKIRIEECNYYTKDTVFHQEQKMAANNVLEAIKIRDQYKYAHKNPIAQIEKYIEHDVDGNPYIDWKNHIVPIPPPLEDHAFCSSPDGVILFSKNGEIHPDLKRIPSMIDYMDDFLFILEVINNKVNKTICQERISLLKQKFQMHQTLNNAKELIDQRQIWGRDFYNTVKVDNHIHHSAAMNAQHLLSFILRKLDTEGDVVVSIDPVTKEPQTLKQVFDKYELTRDRITLDSLSVKADRTIYMRFDNFNNKYNPMGQAIFREIFMKTDNLLEGRYLAELTREMIDKLEQDRFVYTEWRLSIYGKNRTEWKKLAYWVQSNKLQSKYNRWMIQIPRLYGVYKHAGLIQNFQQMLDNIFMPLFEVTMNPETDPDLFQFLISIGGFDTVDDESTYEHFLVDDLKKTPSQFSDATNPHYAYWVYYIYANIMSLNILRKERGLNTYKFRPHCGEAGDIDHLICAFLLSDGINHGILLERNPVLLYMYFLKQIGLAMSPLSNNKLFLKYAHSPFYDFFKVGINVTLSTDDPLILHTTNDPLLEEYAISSQIWDLSSVDIAELARNSVKQCAFEKFIKYHWAGKYDAYAPASNRYQYSNLPQSRYIYRLETLHGEYMFLHQLKSEKSD